MLSRGRSQLAPDTREELALRKAKLLTKGECNALDDLLAAFTWGDPPFEEELDIGDRRHGRSLASPRDARERDRPDPAAGGVGTNPKVARQHGPQVRARRDHRRGSARDWHAPDVAHG